MIGKRSRPKILLTGKAGQVGRELLPRLQQIGDVTSFEHNQLDLTKPDDIRHAIRDAQPNLIVNAAAYTAVDRAESDESVASAANAVAPAVMAEEAKTVGALLVHYSTDYVFDGTKATPYVEDDAPNPLNVYGKTKLEGEQAIQQIGPAHLIFRTAWVYAREGRNFLLTVLRLATEKEDLRIVCDQHGAPTSATEIATATANILARISLSPSGSSSQISGIYHMTASGETTWYDFARSILGLAAQKPACDWFRVATSGRRLIARGITPIATAEFPTPALRPAYSVLGSRKLNNTFGVKLPHWEDQLRATFFADRIRTAEP
jgi:dTDP-4-dehydrorhamnose reductase